MACCSVRKAIAVLQILQLIATVERQVFDFLGFMWAPIVGNFLHLCFIVIGLFGVSQYRPKYVITYGIWCLIWLALNLLVISLYLEIGAVTYVDDWLSFKTNHFSWFKENGAGCSFSEVSVNRTKNATQEMGTIKDCLLEFEYVETIQAGIQCLLAILAFPLAFFLAKNLHEEDDRFDFIGGFDSQSAYEPPSKSSRLHMEPLCYIEHSEECFIKIAKLAQTHRRFLKKLGYRFINLETLPVIATSCFGGDTDYSGNAASCFVQGLGIRLKTNVNFLLTKFDPWFYMQPYP